MWKMNYNDDEGFTKEHTCYLSNNPTNPNPAIQQSSNPARAVLSCPQGTNVKGCEKSLEAQQKGKITWGENRPNLTMIISGEIETVKKMWKRASRAQSHHNRSCILLAYILSRSLQQHHSNFDQPRLFTYPSGRLHWRWQSWTHRFG